MTQSGLKQRCVSNLKALRKLLLLQPIAAQHPSDTADTLTHPCCSVTASQRIHWGSILETLEPEALWGLGPCYPNGCLLLQRNDCSWQLNTLAQKHSPLQGSRGLGARESFLEGLCETRIAKRCPEHSVTTHHAGIKLTSFWPAGTQGVRWVPAGTGAETWGERSSLSHSLVSHKPEESQ